MEMENTCPLVTVGVISYNSSKTIIETLDSIYSQSYQNIELIISDDGSKDNTITLCSEWLEEHSARFIKSLILTSDKNHGTAINCNHLINNATGEWLKTIAADDILLPNCICDCISYVSAIPWVEWFFGKIRCYTNTFEEKNYRPRIDYYQGKKLLMGSGDNEVQKSIIIEACYVEAPAVFIKTHLIRAVGGYDERYPLMEDWPLWKKLTFAGYPCYFLDKEIVGYRVHKNSTTNSTTKLFNINFVKTEYSFIKNELFPLNSKQFKLKKKLYYFLCCFFEKLGLNNSTRTNIRLFAFLSGLINKI